MRARTFVGTVVAALVSVIGSAQAPPWSARLDAVFADVAQPGSPGCALAVYRDGRIAYERGYGAADLERNVPITPSSVFYVGSLSKQFTAFAVALAAAEGKLSLDDDVRKWIAELPDYGSRITVRHLVHHTSGLRDYNTLFDIAGRRNDEAFDNHIVLGIVARQRALNFRPGDEYLYSNSGYVLLSLIVLVPLTVLLVSWRRGVRAEKAYQRRLLEGELLPNVAAVAVQSINTDIRAVGAAIKAREQEELVKRLTALEEGLEQNRGGSRSWGG